MAHVSHVRQLRREYPVMSIERFAEIYSSQRHDPITMENSMMVEELRAIERLESEPSHDERIRESLELDFRQFLGLVSDLALPPGVDTDHARAIVVYGLVAPGGRNSYVGRSIISGVNLRGNVRNKLGVMYDDRKYEAALDALIHDGLIVVSGKRSDTAYALNAGGSTAVTDRGRHNIAVAHAALRAKL